MRISSAGCPSLTTVSTPSTPLSESFRRKNSSTFSASGNVHFTAHINAKGKGVGLITGAKYEWNEAINESVNFDGSDGATYTGTFTQRFRLIGQGRVPDRFMNALFHMTVNANGEVTSFKSEFEDTCP